MPRPKKRVNLLADAHDELQEVYGKLAGIDLRSLRGNGELKEAIRDARGYVEEAMYATGEAIKADQMPISA